MSTTDFIQVFEQLGVTATMLTVFGWYIIKKDKERAEIDKSLREREYIERDKLMKSLDENRLVNVELLQTNKELSETNRILVNDINLKLNLIENEILKR